MNSNDDFFLQIREDMGRIHGFAIFDVGGTVISAYLISKYFETSFPLTLVGLWGIGEIAHLYFKVETPITKIVKGENIPSTIINDETQLL